MIEGYIGIEVSLRNEIFFHDAHGVVWLLDPTQERDMPLRIIKVAEPTVTDTNRRENSGRRDEKTRGKTNRDGDGRRKSQ